MSACESGPFAISTNVKETDTFWIKSQPYSLRHMLDGVFVEEFAGARIPGISQRREIPSLA